MKKMVIVLLCVAFLGCATTQKVSFQKPEDERQIESLVNTIFTVGWWIGALR